jgi:hypothetical protein
MRPETVGCPRRRRARLLVLTLLAWTAASGFAGASVRSISASEWVVSDPDVTVRYTLPKSAAAVLVSPEHVVPTTAKVADYVLTRLSVRADGANCPPVDQGYDLGRVDILYAPEDRYVFEIRFRCPKGSRQIALRNDAIFNETPAHLDATHVELKGGPSISRLLRSNSRDIAIATGTPLEPTATSTYFDLGAGHLLGSFEHLCFVLAVFLGARTRHELRYAIGGLAGGYAVAAWVAATGVLELNQRTAESFAASLLVSTALLVLVRRRQGGPAADGYAPSLEPDLAPTRGASILLVVAALSAVLTTAIEHDLSFVPALAGAGLFGACLMFTWNRWPTRPGFWVLPTAAFGLLDGFSLPSDFAALGPSFALERFNILAFNGGAVVAAAFALALCVLAAKGARVAARRTPASHTLGRAIKDLAIATLVGLGSYWMVTG